MPAAMKSILSHLVFALAAGAAAGSANGQGVYGVSGPWIDDASSAFALGSLAGTYTVATMAYGACQKVCSTSVRRVEELHDLAERRHLSLNFVVFGLDPSADKPSDWAAFRAERKLAFSNLQFLSGSATATQKMASWLGVRYWRYGEHTMHDFRIVLVSPAGRIIRSIDHFEDDITELLP
jgi:cytochrome oxidase Cu insertion factor (SCO1/SenC/PrrC family)